MATVIGCPSCQSSLSVPDSLLGKQVRCASCNALFFATANPTEPDQRDQPAGSLPAPALAIRLSLDDLPASSAPPPASPKEQQAASPPADLPPAPSLDDEPEPSSASPPSSGQPRLVGAVELSPGPNDNQPEPPPAEPLPPRAVPSSRSQRPDADKDTRECPECGRYIHQDARRCYHCGARLGRDRQDEEEPRTRSRSRRDCLPHRGDLILGLGVVSLVCLAACGPIGLALGIFAWVMGHQDLNRMDAQQMDDRGRGLTHAGWMCGILGTCLNLLWTLGCAGFFTWVIIDNSRYNKPPFRPPPPQPLRKMMDQPFRREV